MSIIWWDCDVEHLPGQDNRADGAAVRISCTGSRRPQGTARAADSGRLGRTPADAPVRPASDARLAGAKGKGAGPLNAEEAAQAAADLTRGPLAAAPSG